MADRAKVMVLLVWKMYWIPDLMSSMICERNVCLRVRNIW